MLLDTTPQPIDERRIKQPVDEIPSGYLKFEIKHLVSFVNTKDYNIYIVII